MRKLTSMGRLFPSISQSSQAVKVVSANLIRADYVSVFKALRSYTWMAAAERGYRLLEAYSVRT
jgi:hypothetical protein